MRIRMLTPIDEHSAIAAKSLAIAEALACHVDVDVVGEPTNFPRITSFPVHPLPLSPHLPHADFWLVALGNSPFHCAALQLVEREPTLVMLHDLTLLGAAVSVDRSATPEFTIGDVVESEYGAEVRQELSDPQDRGRAHYSLQYGLLERYLRHARGVVTHSRFAVEHVQARTTAPVRLAFLPLTEPAGVPQRSGRPVMLSLGHVNWNRSLTFVLNALSRLPPDVRPLYRIVGPVAPDVRHELNELVRQLDLTPSVVVTGRASESQLNRELAEASIFVNLRMPVLEAASDTLLRQMASGAPVIVYDHGCYSDIPDDAAVKLSVDAGIDVLAQAIRALMMSPERRASIGTAAIAHVAEHHTTANYAQVVVDLAQDALLGQPHADLLRRLGSKMEAGGLVRTDAVVAQIAGEAEYLFGRFS